MNTEHWSYEDAAKLHYQQATNRFAVLDGLEEVNYQPTAGQGSDTGEKTFPQVLNQNE